MTSRPALAQLTAQFAADVRARPAQHAEAAAVASISTTRSARACSTRSAGCRGIASRAPRARCSRRHADAIVAQHRPGRRHDRRARLRQRREARAARRGAAGARRVGARAPDRHLAAGARADRAAADAVRTCRSSGISRPTRRAFAQAHRGSTRRRPDAGAAARIQHRQLRHRRRRTRSCAGFAPRVCAWAMSCCSAPTSSSPNASCCSPTTIRSA